MPPPLRLALPVSLCVICGAFAANLAAQDTHRPRVTPTVRLVRKVLPAVVSVRVQRAGKQTDQVEFGHGGGSVIHEDGYILTNSHVVAGAKTVEVAFFQKEWLKARVIARLPSEDLALLKLDGDQPRATLPLGRSHDLELGEPVVTIGSAGALPHTLSTGIISGLGRSTNTEHAHLPSMVQTTAPISGGSSGGALVNALGQQIGVITSRKSDGENLGFAITVDRVREVFPRLLNVKERFGIVHGVEVDPFHDAGAKVVAVADDSPASAAALQAGDVIQRIGDRSVRSGLEFQLALIGRTAGDSLTLHIQRGDEELTLPLLLQAAPMLEPVDVEGLKRGLQLERYHGQWQRLPDFDALTPAETLVWDQSPATQKDEALNHYAERFTGYVKIPADELYTFAIRSDDGSRLHVGGRMVADNDGSHPEQEVAGTVRLRKGLYPLRIEYFEATGEQMLRVSVDDANGRRKQLPADWLFHAP